MTKITDQDVDRMLALRARLDARRALEDLQLVMRLGVYHNSPGFIRRYLAGARA